LGLIFRNVISCKRYKGKATDIPVWAWAGPLDSRRLRLPEFLDNWHMNMARSSVVCTGYLYPPGDTSGTHFYYRLS